MKQSDLSLKSYLQQVGVSYSTYHYWRKKCSVVGNNVNHELAPISFKRCQKVYKTAMFSLNDTCVTSKYSPGSQAGKAITYAYTRWDGMTRCLEDGRLLWDNNLAENVIRPITLNRKNYLSCGNHEATVNMSVICSLLATCKAHDINPMDIETGSAHWK